MFVEVKHISTISLAIPQEVRCEKCRFEFFYELKLTSVGESTSAYGIQSTFHKGKAGNKAEQQMAELLKDPNLCSPVPCPKCLHYQSYMRDESARKEYARWEEAATGLFVVGALPLLIAAVAWFLDSPDNAAIWGAIGGASFALGILTLVLRSRLMSRHDPDAMSERNRRKAAEEALTFDELQDSQARHVAKQYRRFQDLELKEPFVIDLWLTPDMIAKGGVFDIQVPKGDLIEFQVPPGEAEATHPLTCADENKPKSAPALYENKFGDTFMVRTMLIRTHPAEQDPDGMGGA